MPDEVDLQGAAYLLHRSYAWFRENWRELVRDQNFPRPFIGEEKHGRPRWRTAAIERWKDWKSGLIDLDLAQRPEAQVAAPRIANDPAAQPIRPAGRVAALVAAAGGRR